MRLSAPAESRILRGLGGAAPIKRLSVLLGMTLLFVPSVASAQRVRFAQQAVADDDEETEVKPQQTDEGQPVPLRARFGTDRAEALLRASDADDVRQGIERAAATGTPEAVALLVAQAQSTNNDDLALIDLARALGPFVHQDNARQALVSLMNASTHVSPAQRRDRHTQAPSPARVELARRIAARALVASHDPLALEAVFNAAREGGTGNSEALRALASDPEVLAMAPLGAPSGPSGARALAQSGDLRTLDVLLAKAQSGEAPMRAASLLALGQLGDGRARSLAIAAFADSDPHVRAAAGETLVLLDAPERFKAVAQLLSSDDTAAAGVRLAHRAQDADVVKALAARFKALSNPDMRQSIVVALGRGVATDEGIKLLADIAAEPQLGGDAALALARSPNAAAMGAIERLAQNPAPAVRRLAVRAYVARALLRGERSSALDSAASTLSRSTQSADRALGAFAHVALGGGAESLLSDHDASVRRAAAMGTLAAYDGHLPTAGALLARYAKETDEATRAVLALGLLDGDAEEIVPTLTLVQRVEAGGADALISATALAARKGDSFKEKIDGLFASSDPVMRAHVARGLAASLEPSATGRLAEAARYEAEPLVRLAEVTALARRPPAPVREELLRITARFDPEARIREVASRALMNATPPAAWPIREVAWLRVATADGQPPAEGMVGTYITSDGVAIPVAFDADGYALVAGAPPGDGRLVLAPVLPKR